MLRLSVADEVGAGSALGSNLPRNSRLESHCHTRCGKSGTLRRFQEQMSRPAPFYWLTFATGSDCCSDEFYVGITMRTLIRKLVLGTVSVLALGLAGSVASSLLHVPDARNTATAASIPAVVETTRDALAGDALRRDDIRWAQAELRFRGLYQGSLDGIVGSETKHALSEFQKSNGLSPSESLDAQTWEALTGSGIPAVAEGARGGRTYRN
jgi:Putative peptidoglycan binding domain